jgi:hypothetical protein
VKTKQQRNKELGQIISDLSKFEADLARAYHLQLTDTLPAMVNNHSRLTSKLNDLWKEMQESEVKVVRKAVRKK